MIKILNELIDREVSADDDEATNPDNLHGDQNSNLDEEKNSNPDKKHDSTTGLHRNHSSDSDLDDNSAVNTGKSDEI